MRRRIRFVVNGKPVELEMDPSATLLEIIRDQLGLTGTKEGCGDGDCGACTVIMDGRAVNSCLILAPEAHERDILTIEGLAENGKLHPIQEVFIENGGIQCGFCTPGMILVAKVLLDEIPNPTEEQIREAIAGNLCRCTGYVKIIESIQSAATRMAGR